MGNSQQVAPPGEKPARRRAIPPALRGGVFPPFLSFVKRPVRTRMRGVVGAGEGDLPGYPIGRLHPSRQSSPSSNWTCDINLPSDLDGLRPSLQRLSKCSRILPQMHSGFGARQDHARRSPTENRGERVDLRVRPLRYGIVVKQIPHSERPIHDHPNPGILGQAKHVFQGVVRRVVRELDECESSVADYGACSLPIAKAGT